MDEAHQQPSSVPTHLIYFGDGKTTFVCRLKKPDSDFRTVIYPQSNCAKHVTCPECLVGLDDMVERGEAAVRKDTQVVIFANECGHMLNVTTFIQFAKADGLKTFDRNDIRELAENTGLSLHDISTQIRENGLILVPPKDAEKVKYEFKSGGTFGFHGLK